MIGSKLSAVSDVYPPRCQSTIRRTIGANIHEARMAAVRCRLSRIAKTMVPAMTKPEIARSGTRRPPTAAVAPSPPAVTSRQARNPSMLKPAPCGCCHAISVRQRGRPTRPAEGVVGN